MELCILPEEKKEKFKNLTKCPICQGELDTFIEFITDHTGNIEARCSQCQALSYTKKVALH